MVIVFFLKSKIKQNSLKKWLKFSDKIRESFLAKLPKDLLNKNGLSQLPIYNALKQSIKL